MPTNNLIAKKSIIFDRDGTLIVDKHYLKSPDQVELLPYVAETLVELTQSGWQLFVVTNQSGVGRGYFTKDDVILCNNRLLYLLKQYKVTITGIEYCPHAPEDNCTCRKPLIGMWQRLHQRFAIDPAQSIMVGDKPEDMAFAANAQLAGRVLVATGKGTKTIETLQLSVTSPCQHIIPQNNQQPQAIIQNFSFLPCALAALLP